MRAQVGVSLQPLTAVSRNGWFYFSLAGNYSTGNLHIFTTKRKIVATARSRGTLPAILNNILLNEKMRLL
jgi:hypothetical protein